MALILPISGVVVAQSANPAATLSGVITDPAGAVVVGAAVTVRNAATGQARTARTDAIGIYQFINLAPGEYELEVEAEGFARLKRTGVKLLVGQSVRLDLTIVPAGVTSYIEVSAEPPAVDVTQTTPSVALDQERIEKLPVTQRRFLSFVLTAPGLVSSAAQSRGGSSVGVVGSRHIPDSGFSFGGLRARSNSVAIDGVDSTDETTGASRVELSIEAIREFQVINNGVSAEFGGASGGSINAITRTGTNAWHGDVFTYTSHHQLNARQPLFTSSEITHKPRLHRWQPGLALGGPIKRDHTFFHASFEQEHELTEDASDVDSEAVARINAALASGHHPRLGARHLSTGLFQSAGDNTEAALKLNQQLSSSSSLMLRYAFTNDRRWRDALRPSGLAEYSSLGDSLIRDHALVGQWIHIIGQRAVSDLRFQIARRHVLLRPNEGQGPEVFIPGVINFGRATNATSERTEDHYQILQTSAMSRGHHQVSFGGAINHVRLDASLADRFGGFVVFNSLEDFLAGEAELFAQSFGTPATKMSVTSLGAFIQDHLQMPMGLTLDLGLRYDYEALPALFRRDTNNLSPRIGIAYSPDRRHRWVIRVAYGIYFDRYLLAFLNQTIQKDGVHGFEQVIEGHDAAAAFRSSRGGPLIAPLPGIRPSIYRPDPRLATPYSQKLTAGIEHQLFSDVTLSLNYLFVKGTKLPRTRNVNLLPPIILTSANAALIGVSNPKPQQVGRPVFSNDRLDPRYDAIYQLEDASGSTYHALTASLGRKITKRFGLLASYTLSKTLDDASDFDEQPENPYDLRAERALSRQDQRQRFVLSGVFDLFGEVEEATKASQGWLRNLLSGIEFAPIITLASGRRYNPLVGNDANRNHELPLSSRPLGFERNSLSGPAFKNIDLRVLKRIRVHGGRALAKFAADFFNLTNTINVREISPFFGTGLVPLRLFAKAIDAASARRIQLSVEFEF